VFIPLCVGIPAGQKSAGALALSMALGVMLCYGCGTLWYTLVYTGGSGFMAALAVCVLPYVLPDAVKIALAVHIALRLRRLRRG
jgi:biotin transport system substrate-specific component